MTGDMGLLMFNFCNLGMIDSRLPLLPVFAHVRFQLSGWFLLCLLIYPMGRHGRQLLLYARCWVL